MSLRSGIRGLLPTLLLLGAMSVGCPPKPPPPLPLPEPTPRPEPIPVEPPALKCADSTLTTEDGKCLLYTCAPLVRRPLSARLEGQPGLRLPGSTQPVVARLNGRLKLQVEQPLNGLTFTRGTADAGYHGAPVEPLPDEAYAARDTTLWRIRPQPGTTLKLALPDGSTRSLTWSDCVTESNPFPPTESPSCAQGDYDGRTGQFSTAFIASFAGTGPGAGERREVPVQVSGNLLERTVCFEGPLSFCGKLADLEGEPPRGPASPERECEEKPVPPGQPISRVPTQPRELDGGTWPGTEVRDGGTDDAGLPEEEAPVIIIEDVDGGFACQTAAGDVNSGRIVNPWGGGR
jgi:hypothetical protein